MSAPTKPPYSNARRRPWFRGSRPPTRRTPGSRIVVFPPSSPIAEQKKSQPVSSEGNSSDMPAKPFENSHSTDGEAIGVTPVSIVPYDTNR